MTYIARHYVEIAGEMYSPGDFIVNEIPADQLARYLRVGAVTPNPVYDMGTANEDAIATDNGTGESGKTDNSSTDNGYDADDTDIEDPADAPVIDVADGIVTQDEAPAKPGKKGKA